MNDMTPTIMPKATELTADHLVGGPRTIQITNVSIQPGERPVAISFAGDDGLPFRPCKTVCRILVAAWGPDASKYVGRQVTLYRDPTIKFGALMVGGIRPSHISHIDAPLTMALTMTKGSKKAFTVQPLREGPKTSPAPSDAAPDIDAREKWVNEMIAWLGNQTEMRLVDGLEKKKRADIDALPEDLRAPFDLALVNAKARISKGASQ